MSTPSFIQPVLAPADIEFLAQSFLVPLMTPTPVATRLPDDTDPTDSVNGFLRVEAAAAVKINWFQYNVSVFLHLYVPFESEVLGQTLIDEALGYMGAAGGLTVGGRYVSQVAHVMGPARKTDPDVNLLRYFGGVTWTLDGAPV